MEGEFHTLMFFDLLKSITTDVAFIEKIRKILHDMLLAADVNDDEAFRHHLLLLLRACDYNPSLLVPYFFPKYPNDKPMTFWSRPHAFSMMAFIPNGTLTIQASRQIGKCVDGNTSIKVKHKNEITTQTLKGLFDEAKEKVHSDNKAVDG